MKKLVRTTLFGEIEIQCVPKYKANGYAAAPGTGPKGETCGNCASAIQRCGGARSFWKCLLMKSRWSGSYGTDIRLKSPACRMFKSKEASNE